MKRGSPSPSLFPKELDICLSNRCNMACRYCYFETLNEGPPLFLDFRQVAKALDLYLTGAEGRTVEKISIAGGEPFLDFPLLERIVRRIHERAGTETDIELFTNGTFLTAERARRVMDLGAKLVLSLDGGRRGNDLNRRFRSAPRKSVFDAVMERVKTLPKKVVDRICVGMTFTAETAESLAENVRALRDAGFREIQLNMDMLEVWDEAGHKALRRGVRGLDRYYRSIVADRLKDFESFRFGLDYLLLRERGDTLRNTVGFRDISLGPDGGFYPGGLVSTYGMAGHRFRIGSADDGIDEPKMRALRARAARKIVGWDKKTGLTRYITNPMLLYFAVELKGIDPLRLFRSTRRAFEIFHEEMGPILEVERTITELTNDPDFGDFAHEPPRVCGEEASELRIELSPVSGARRKAAKAPPVTECGQRGTGQGRALAALRDGVDFFLYSPGSRKTLILAEPRGADGRERLRALAVYSILKARRLGKALRLRAESSRPLDKKTLSFAAEHGIVPSLRTSAPGSAAARRFAREAGGDAAAVVPLVPGAPAGRKLEACLRSGFREAVLEPRPPDRVGASKAAGSLRKAAREAADFAVRAAGKGLSFHVENVSRLLSKGTSSERAGLLLLPDGTYGRPAAVRPELRAAFDREMARAAREILRRAPEPGSKFRDYARACLKRAHGRSILFGAAGGKA